MKRRVVVVGGGVAGVAAAASAAKQGAHTTLIESSRTVGVSRALLPFVLSKGLRESDLVVPEARSLEGLKVNVRTGEAVTSVDRSGRKVRVRGGRSVDFDSLVVCTGAAAQPSGLRGASKPKVFSLGQASDYLRLLENLDDIESVAVTGPVSLALKIGEALASRGRRVEVFCGKDGLATQLSEPVANMVRRAAHDVVLVDDQVESILGTNKVEAVLSSGSVRTCDCVVIAPRSAPSFPDIDCERGPNGGLLVDSSMATTAPKVFAAGDSAELKFRSGSIPARLHSTSRLGGEVAGRNAAGGHARGRFSWAYEQEFFGVEYCSAGVAEREASALGMDSASETYTFGDDQETYVSIVYDRETQQVCGLQVAGWRASSFSSAASMVVSLGLTVEQLLEMEFPYSPEPGRDSSPIALTAGKIRGLERA